jgi:hypothetical protein
MSARIWTCSVCKKQERWNKSWSWYGSLREEEDFGFDDHQRNAVCSEACKALHKPVKLKETQAEIVERKRETKRQRKAPKEIVNDEAPRCIVRSVDGTAIRAQFGRDPSPAELDALDALVRATVEQIKEASR